MLCRLWPQFLAARFQNIFFFFFSPRFWNCVYVTLLFDFRASPKENMVGREESKTTANAIESSHRHYFCFAEFSGRLKARNQRKDLVNSLTWILIGVNFRYIFLSVMSFIWIWIRAWKGSHYWIFTSFSIVRVVAVIAMLLRARADWS